MVVNKTYGYIKKRILDLLCENTAGQCLTDDIGREEITSHLTDTLNVCLNRMYECLPLGKKSALCTVMCSNVSGLVQAELPEDFYRLINVNGENHSDFRVINGVLYLPDIYEGNVCVTYKGRVPTVDDNTSNEYEFDLPELVIEALCTLSAAELCRPEENALYTRLIYKYGDLSEGIYNTYTEKTGRSDFFYKASKKRWG